MSDLNEEFSLASFLDLDVSDIEEVRFEDLPAGVYIMEITDSGADEDEKDGEKRVVVSFETTIQEVSACLDPAIKDTQTLVGKKHTTKFYVYPEGDPEKAAAVIGRIRAFITDFGGESKGQLGLILGNSKGLISKATIFQRPDKNDKSRKYATLKLEPRKAA